MSETELHLLHLGLLDTVNEALHLETDASEELISDLAGFTVDTQLLGDGLAELVISDEELILNLLLHDVLRQELVQALGHLALHEFVDGFHGILGVLELGEGLELDDAVCALSILESFVEFVKLLELLVFGDLEQGKACCGFE